MQSRHEHIQDIHDMDRQEHIHQFQWYLNVEHTLSHLFYHLQRASISETTLLH